MTLLSEAIGMDSPDTAPRAATISNTLRQQAQSATVLIAVSQSGATTVLLLSAVLAPSIARYATIIAAALLVQVGANGYIVVGRSYQARVGANQQRGRRATGPGDDEARDSPHVHDRHT